MLTCFNMSTFQNLKILKNANCPILDRMSLWFCLLCNFSQCSNQSVLKYMISRYFYKVFLLFHTLRSDGPIISLHEGYCHDWFCVCASVFYCDAWQKHKPNIHKCLLSTLTPAGLCWFMFILAIFWRLSPQSRVNLMKAESNYTNVCFKFCFRF